MNQRLLLIMIITMAFLLMACNGATKESGSAESVKSEPESEAASEEADTDPSFDSVSLEDASNDDSSSGTEDRLSTYPPENIEYARVWLQMGGLKEVGELHVRHISAGEPVNPYDDNSVDYPEDVTVLKGKIMADGVVTYSSNGDGTINVYNVPSHWPSSEQIEESMEEYTTGIVEDTEQVSVGTGDDDAIIRLLEKIKD